MKKSILVGSVVLIVISVCTLILIFTSEAVMTNLSGLDTMETTVQIIIAAICGLFFIIVHRAPSIVLEGEKPK